MLRAGLVLGLTFATIAAAQPAPNRAMLEAFAALQQTEADDAVPAQEALNVVEQSARADGNVTVAEQDAIDAAKARVAKAEFAKTQAWLLVELTADCPTRAARVAQGRALLRQKITAALGTFDAEVAKQKRALQDAARGLAE